MTGSLVELAQTYSPTKLKMGKAKRQGRWYLGIPNAVAKRDTNVLLAGHLHSRHQSMISPTMFTPLGSRSDGEDVRRIWSRSRQRRRTVSHKDYCLQGSNGKHAEAQRAHISCLRRTRRWTGSGWDESRTLWIPPAWNMYLVNGRREEVEWDEEQSFPIFVLRSRPAPRHQHTTVHVVLYGEENRRRNHDKNFQRPRRFLAVAYLKFWSTLIKDQFKRDKSPALVGLCCCLHSGQIIVLVFCSQQVAEMDPRLLDKA